MSLMSIGEFVLKLGVIEKELHMVGEGILAMACEMIAKEARAVIGTGYDDWPELKPETIAEKVRKGFYAPAPLLRTGELRESIEWTVSGHEGAVGSDSELAVWHELGTSKIPPRPFLAGTAKAMEDKIHKMAARAVVAIIAGKGMGAIEVAELMHVLREMKHAYHALKRAGENVTEPLQENERGHRR